MNYNRNALKWAVISYWVGETGDTEFWLYSTEEEAQAALKRLWKQSYDYATEDDDFDADTSYCEESFGIISWKDGLNRFFEVRKQNLTETI